MPINSAFLDELEEVKAPPLPQDYLFPQPPEKNTPGINYAFLDSLEAEDHPEVLENKAATFEARKAMQFDLDKSISQLESPDGLSVPAIADPSAPSTLGIGPQKELSIADSYIQNLPPQVKGQRVPDLDLEPAESLLKRYGKQLYNAYAKIPAETIYSLGGGKVMNLGASYLLRKKAKEKGIDLSLLDASRMIKSGVKDKLQKIPLAEVKPAQKTSEKVADVAAGLTAFISQLALTRKVLPKGTPEPVIWEVQNQLSGGVPGEGATMAAAFGAIGKIPAVSVSGKVAKVSAQSGLLAGITAATGGEKEDIIISALVPVVLASYNSARGRISDAQMVRSWRQKLPFTRDIPLKSSLNYAKAMRSAFEMSKTKDFALKGKEYRQWNKRYGKTVDTFLKQADKAFKATQQPKPVGLLPSVPTEAARPALKPVIEPQKAITKAKPTPVPPKAVSAVEKGKQPWEMTREEYRKGKYREFAEENKGLTIQEQGTSFAKEALRKNRGAMPKMEDSTPYERFGINTILVGKGHKQYRHNLEALKHKKTVKQALSQNKPIPLEVLEEYKGESWADEAIADKMTGIKRANPVLFRTAQRSKSVDEFINKMSKGEPETVSTEVLTNFYNKVKALAKLKPAEAEKEIKNEIKPEETITEPAPSAKVEQRQAEEPTAEVPSPSGGFVGGRPATAKVSAIVKEDLSTGSENADAFLRRTKGFTNSGQPGLLIRVAKNIGRVFKEFHYLPDLPKQKEYADVREAFRHTEEIKRLAYNTAVEKMRWALKPIEGVKWETRAKMKALEMKIIADDLAEDAGKNVDLPSDLTKTDVKTMKKRADKLYNKYPSVKEAYDRLRKITREIGDLLVSERMLDANKAKEFYFPHKVIKYLRENDSFFGIPSKKPADYKKGYLKKRKGGYDYSTDIMERLVEHWAQVRRDIDYSRFLAKTLKQEQANYFKKEHPDWEEFTTTEDGKRIRNLVPEGYKEVTVLPGRFYYATHGVTEDMAKAIIAQNLDSIEDMLEEDAAKQVRKVLAVGRKKSFIVREPIARQIHNMPTMPISTAPAYLAVKGFNTFVKGQILFNPLYALPFHLTNFTGDAHKNLVALPSSLGSKYLANYWKQVIAAHEGEKSERFEMAQKYGVIGSGWIGTDLPELKAIMPEIERAEVSGAAKVATNKMKRLWNLVKKVGSGREDWLRYALFDRLLDLQAEGKDIIKYAIKDSKTLSGITDKNILAAKVARDIAGDYAAIGKTGKMLSDLAIPFYRWMHLNLPWWPRMVKEYVNKGQYGQLIYALLAASAPYVLSVIWNYLSEERGKYERSLPYWKRWNFHINSLRGKKMYYIPLPLDDVLDFTGVPEHILDFQRYQRGMITGSELTKRIAWNLAYEPGMSVVNSIGGAAGVVRDTIGVTTYPDIKPWIEKRWSRKGLNIAGDIFGAPAQLGKAIRREGIELDESGRVILGPKTKDLLNRSWMGIRPYSVDIEKTKELKAKSTYKRTSRKQGQEKGKAHKGKKRLVDSLDIQLEGEKEKPDTNKIWIP